MYWGNGETFEVRVFDIGASATLTRAPKRIVRYATTGRAVNPEMRERAVRLTLRRARNAADSATRRERWENFPARETLPAFQSLRVDGNGNIWAEHVRLTTITSQPDEPPEKNIWTVFDSTGVLLGDVELPRNVRVLQIGDGWMLGRWQDENDVVHIRLYEISRGVMHGRLSESK
jgi:hypothetical protein